MQIDLNHIALAIIVVALIFLFGTERLMYFVRDVQKAWSDFRGMFRRKARDDGDSNL